MIRSSRSSSKVGDSDAWQCPAWKFRAVPDTSAGPRVFPMAPGTARTRSSRDERSRASSGGHDEIFSGRRSQAVRPSGEVTLGERGARDVLHGFETGLTGQVHHFLWRVKADE